MAAAHAKDRAELEERARAAQGRAAEADVAAEQRKVLSARQALRDAEQAKNSAHINNGHLVKKLTAARANGAGL